MTRTSVAGDLATRRPRGTPREIRSGPLGLERDLEPMLALARRRDVALGGDRRGLELVNLGEPAEVAVGAEARELLLDRTHCARRTERSSSSEQGRATFEPNGIDEAGRDVGAQAIQRPLERRIRRDGTGHGEFAAADLTGAAEGEA